MTPPSLSLARTRSAALALRTPALLAAGVLLLLAGAIHVGHYDTGLALRALWVGSFGSWYAITSGTLVRAVPLILTGLGVAIAFRAGVFNIGAEGQLLAGAIVATFVGVQFGAALGPAGWAVALMGGAVAGALWAGIAAFLRVRFGVLEVISTIMLNFVAEYLVSYLVRGPMQEHLHIYPQTESIAASTQLGVLIPGTRLHWGFAIAVACVILAWMVINRTAAGFRLRVVGANPSAAWVAGRIHVVRTTVVALLVSGALAGLAGAIEVTGVTYALYENLSPGYGFTAIAVAVLAGLNPLGVLGTGVLFAALETGATAMQRDAGVPSVFAGAIEAALILAIVALAQRHGRVAQSRGTEAT